MQAYGEAIAGKDHRDVTTAVNRLIGGKIQRNHEYIPPPGQVLFQIDKARDERLDDEARNKPRIRPPRLDTSPEAIAQRKAFIANVVRPAINDMRSYDAPTQAQHDAMVRATIAEAMGIDTATLSDMIAKLPDRKPKAPA